jgi:hypothetical protein
MVQQHKWGTNEILVRVSPDAWGGILWADYGYTPDSNTMMKNVGDDTAGVDPPCNGQVYQQTAQWEISNQASNQLMISYYCTEVNHNLEAGHNVSPWNCNNVPAMYWRGTGLDPTVAASLRTSIEGRIRFYNQNLTKLRPWCTTGTPSCDMP